MADTVAMFCDHEGVRVIVEAIECDCPEEERTDIFVTRDGPSGERVDLPFSTCDACVRCEANYCCTCNGLIRFALAWRAPHNAEEEA